MGTMCAAGTVAKMETDMTNSAPLIRTEHLRKYYPIRKGFLKNKVVGTIKAVDDVSFYIGEEEVLGLVGESGCGKSTLSRVLLHLTDLTSGDIWYRGEKATKDNIQTLRQKMQMIFQDPYSSLDPRMTIEKIVAEPLRVHTEYDKNQRRQAVAEVLEKVGLPEDAMQKYPHEFSGGQRQRIGIARALILQPDFIVCDEPVSALDVSIQATILNLFTEMRESFRLSYLFISHDMSVVKHISDRIAVMYMGKIVELAQKDELFSNTLHPYSIALISAIPIPDPKAKRNRIILTGDIPNPVNPPSGCPFRTRCGKASPLCEAEPPVLREKTPGHFVACHLC